MRFKSFYSYILLSGLLLSCSDNNEPLGNDEELPSGEVIMSISTEINTRNVVTSFISGDKMNLFVKEYNTINSNNLFDESINATFTDAKWNINPVIKLGEKTSGFVYAFYPYDENIVSASSISVDASKQIDYLYSGKGVLVSAKSPEAKLSMSHAMSAIAINIVKGDNYTGNGILKSFTLGGDAFKVQGKLNVETGVITPEADGSITVETEKEITNSGWTLDLPQTFTIPFDSDGKASFLAFSIDDTNFQVVLPAMKIERGMKYIFRLGLSDGSITLFNDKTEIVPLQKEDDETGIESKVRIVKYDFIGSKVQLPVISGQNMLPGIVNWGDNSPIEIYNSSGSHTYEGSDVKHSINVENWNADNVLFNNIIGITEIDLSGFN